MVWIDHAYLGESDLEWLAPVERLTVWNVLIPRGFLIKLRRLWWLDIRGGSGTNLAIIKEASRLRYLSINQIRGLHDLSAITGLRRLEFLSVYGLPKVLRMPSLAPSNRIRRVEIGQMGGLKSLSGILDAPGLQELLLIRKIHVGDTDIKRINTHPSLTHFDWFAEDVPGYKYFPVRGRIKLPAAQPLYPEQWFGIWNESA